MKHWGLIASCLTMSACQSAPSSTPLEGHWQFERSEQIIYSPTGEVVEKIVQAPPQASERSLDVTDQELITHHVQTDKSYPGDSNYTVTRSYTRRNNTLFVVPAPGIEAGPVTISQLTEKHLTLHLVPTSTPGGFHYEWNTYFIR